MMVDEALLDSDNFDPIAFINRRFPTESSLDDLDTFTLGLSSQISALDEELSTAVQSQTVSGEQASKEIIEAQKSIDELFVKISDIKAKASQSERMVQEICADIKKLDYAKTHLQTSITALKRLQMLTTAIGQLDSLVGDSAAYRDVANLLDATTQIMNYFEHYSSIPLVSSTQRQLGIIQAQLRKHATRTFRDLGQLIDEGLATDDSAGISGLSNLSDSCLIVDALGFDFRQELIGDFVQQQLLPYEKLFGPEGQHFSLEQVERRWAWFRRLLKAFDQKFSQIFPPHWKVSLKLALEFFERTKIHLTQLLTAMESKGTSDVHALLRALMTSLSFETEMASKYNVTALQKSIAQINAQGQASSKSMVQDEKLRDAGKLLYVPTLDQAISRQEDELAHFMQLATSALSGGISGVFDKFLGSYVLLERSNLEELLQKLSAEEDSVSASEAQDNDVNSSISSDTNKHKFVSSVSMFAFIKSSIKRCTGLTTGQTLLALTKEFKTCLIQYSELLRSRCPVPLVVSASLPHTLTGSAPSLSQPIYRLAPGAEVGVCHIINTGEYCAEVVGQLEQNIKSKINPTLADKVDLSSEVDTFNDLVAHALKTLVSGTMDRLEPSFKAMSAIQWGTTTQVGEESPYCNIIAQQLQEVVSKVRGALLSSFFHTFCAKLATEILQKYQECICKQRRISEPGAQQLLLDTYSIKTVLMRLHSLPPAASNSNPPSTPAASAPQMYVKIVSARVTHIEAILKLVGTPEEVLVERFRVLWPEGGPSDLQMLMSLKGMRRSDQQNFLEGLGLGLQSTVGSAAGAAGAAAASTVSGMAALTSTARSGITAVGSMSAFMRNRGEKEPNK